MFINSITHIIISLELKKYIYAICRNCNNYQLKNKLVICNRKYKKSEDMEEFFGN